MALLGTCDAIKDWPPPWIKRKKGEIEIFHARHVKYVIIKHFAA